MKPEIAYSEYVDLVKVWLINVGRGRMLTITRKTKVDKDHIKIRE